MKVKALKPGGKKVLVGIAIVASIFLIWKFVLQAPKEVTAATTMSKNDIQLATEATSAPSLDASKKLPIPKFNEPVGSGTKILYQIFEWNSQFPTMYAAGGSRTSEGSLFAKYGLDVELRLQSDVFKTVADFVTNTNELADNPNAVPMLWSVMANGMPGFTLMLKDLQKLGDKGKYVVVYHQGRSNGEDAFMGPAEWKRDPQSARGKGVAFVEKDGDADIVVQWCSDNNVPLNANTKVYDPNALNVVGATTYIEAAEKYVSGYTEDRVLVRNGKTVPDSIMKVNVDAVSTWTPADVIVAEKKGGLVRLGSTKEYTSLMPNALIVNKAWAQSHRSDVENFIRALGEAGDQVRSFPEAAQFAAQVSALVYGDNTKDAAYWLKYYKGIKEKDATGMMVELGGSKAFNLADAANVVGLGPDKKDRYKITYETVMKTLKTYYPNEVEGMLPYNDIMDKSFLLGVLANTTTEGGTAEEVEYSESITQEVSNKSVTIEFDNNSATIKPSSYKVLNEIYNSAVIAEGLKLGIVGHSNAVGSDAVNKPLSEQRANAVRQYLIKKGLSPKQIDQARGDGSERPLPGLDPADARNRRVEIILGN